MKRILVVVHVFSISLIGRSATFTWDGGGGDGLWATAANWVGDIVPGASDDVILDNSTVTGSYIVALPPGAISTSVNTLQITPTLPNNITLLLPNTNTAVPGLSVTGPGDAMIINANGLFKNSSGASLSPVFSITNNFRINNNGRYLHNTPRANAAIISQLSTAAGTQNGTFEFDVPGGGAYAVSLTGRTFGNLVLSNSAGAARIYTGNGASDLTIRGNLIINISGVFNVSMTANLLIAGNLDVTGNFDLSPAVGVTGRSILFNGSSNQVASGSGNFTFGTNFHNIEVNAGSKVSLQRAINLSNAGNSFIVNTGGTLQMATNVVSGNGTFQLNTGGWLGMGSPDGITAAPTMLGNVQTATRSFSAGALYEYNGTSTQNTGDGVPTTITKLKINNTAGMGSPGVMLTRNTTISNALDLASGKLTTSASTGIITLADDATATNYSDASFVFGPIIKDGDEDFVFPVGEGASIHTVALIKVSGDAPTDEFQIEYHKADPVTAFAGSSFAPGTDHMSRLEYWIANRNAGSATKKVSLQATTFTDATDLTRLVIIHNPSSIAWQNDGRSASSGTFTGTVTSNDVINFGPFTFASLDPYPSNPLPITLLHFSATKLALTKSSVDWELGAVCSADVKFEIQRANAEKLFTTITILNGNTSDRSYSFIDNDLKNGVNYYRLKMINESGNVSYSRIVAVMNGIAGLQFTALIPTIVTNSSILTVASSGPEKLQLFIVDIQGRMWQKQDYRIAAGNTNIPLSVDRLAAGVYQLVGITAEGKTNIIRFIKQ